MGRFCDLPKDVIWLILREVLFRQRVNRELKEKQFWIETVGFCLNEILISIEDLEQRVFEFKNARLYRYFNWLCNLALINQKSLSVIKSKTKRIDGFGFTFVPGSLTN